MLIITNDVDDDNDNAGDTLARIEEIDDVDVEELIYLTPTSVELEPLYDNVDDKD